MKLCRTVLLLLYPWQSSMDKGNYNEELDAMVESLPGEQQQEM